ncbi:MAG: hypothetical protein QHG99_02420 [Methanomicrobiales archaeon]|nr:hypothetical protein [Methanomicrobiales archaeon]
MLNHETDARARSRVMKEIPMPKSVEAIMSPKMIASRVTGDTMSLSRVLEDPSQGMMAGETAVDVKKRVIPVSPERRNGRERPRPPRKKARKRKTGMKIPNMSTGPFV